ncbi:hypothetical protein BDR26DRAFT_943897 [Obelidium mucronatum]|nr:hypothetical protein BDR26DRAFT_943897 [Obelidium mucronatum]
MTTTACVKCSCCNQFKPAATVQILDDKQWCTDCLSNLVKDRSQTNSSTSVVTNGVASRMPPSSANTKTLHDTRNVTSFLSGVQTLQSQADASSSSTGSVADAASAERRNVMAPYKPYQGPNTLVAPGATIFKNREKRKVSEKSTAGSNKRSNPIQSIIKNHSSGSSGVNQADNRNGGMGYKGKGVTINMYYVPRTMYFDDKGNRHDIFILPFDEMQKELKTLKLFPETITVNSGLLKSALETFAKKGYQMTVDSQCPFDKLNWVLMSYEGGYQVEGKVMFQPECSSERLETMWQQLQSDTMLNEQAKGHGFYQQICSYQSTFQRRTKSYFVHAFPKDQPLVGNHSIVSGIEAHQLKDGIATIAKTESDQPSDSDDHNGIGTLAATKTVEYPMFSSVNAALSTENIGESSQQPSRRARPMIHLDWTHDNPPSDDTTVSSISTTLPPIDDDILQLLDADNNFHLDLEMAYFASQELSNSSEVLDHTPTTSSEAQTSSNELEPTVEEIRNRSAMAAVTRAAQPTPGSQTETVQQLGQNNQQNHENAESSTLSENTESSTLAEITDIFAACDRLRTWDSVRLGIPTGEKYEIRQPAGGFTAYNIEGLLDDEMSTRSFAKLPVLQDNEEFPAFDARGSVLAQTAVFFGEERLKSNEFEGETLRHFGLTERKPSARLRLSYISFGKYLCWGLLHRADACMFPSQMAPQMLLNVLNAPVSWYTRAMVERSGNGNVFQFIGANRNYYCESVKGRIVTHNTWADELELDQYVWGPDLDRDWEAALDNEWEAFVILAECVLKCYTAAGLARRGFNHHWLTDDQSEEEGHVNELPDFQQLFPLVANLFREPTTFDEYRKQFKPLALTASDRERQTWMAWMEIARTWTCQQYCRSLRLITGQSFIPVPKLIALSFTAQPNYCKYSTCFSNVNVSFYDVCEEGVDGVASGMFAGLIAPDMSDEALKFGAV